MNTLIKVNGDWIVTVVTDFYTAECNITQLNPGRHIGGLDIDNTVTLIRKSLEYDLWCYDGYCCFSVFKDHESTWSITLPMQITPNMRTINDLCYLSEARIIEKVDLDSMVGSYKWMKESITKLEGEVRDLQEEVRLLQHPKEKRYKLRKLVKPSYDLIEASINSSGWSVLFKMFGDKYHNCTKEFLIDEFVKTYDLLNTLILRVYAEEHGLRLVNGDVYDSFESVIRWEIIPKTLVHYTVTDDYDYAGMVRFGNEYIGWL